MKAIDILSIVLLVGVGAVGYLAYTGQISIPGISPVAGAGGGGGKRDEEESIVQNLTKENGDGGLSIVRDMIKKGFELGDKELKELADRLAIKKPLAPTKQLGITSTDITRPYKKKADVNREAPESILDMIWPTIDRILPDLTIFAADEAKKRKMAVVNRDAPESELEWFPKYGPFLPEINIKKPDFSRLTSGTRIN